MATSTYHCPNCRAPISFKPDKQLFICDYCNSEFTPEEMYTYFTAQEEKANARAQKELERQEKHKEKAGEEAEQMVHEYLCDNCGANVVTDDTTTSTFCFYCHSPVIITSRLQGDFRPDQMLPFKFSEEQAKERFLDWTRKKKYLPSDFTSAAHLEKMTGLYLPYWYVDSDISVNFSGTSKNVSSWRSGDYVYRETSIYKHERQGTYYLRNVNLAAFEKIDQNLLNGIEPFDTSEFVPFAMPMLSGFFTENFTFGREEGAKAMQNEIESIAEDMLDSSLGGAEVTPSHKELINKDHEWKLSLLPIWVLTYNYLDRIYVYAMNGQSGRAFGEMPIVMSKLKRDAALRGVLAGLAAALIAYVIMYFLRFGL